jgi:hypothetical protein
MVSVSCVALDIRASLEPECGCFMSLDIVLVFLVVFGKNVRVNVEDLPWEFDCNLLCLCCYLVYDLNFS